MSRAPLPLPDTLRPTELCDFGDAFRKSPRPARMLAAVAGLAILLAWAHLAPQGTVQAEGGSVTAAALASARP